MENNIQHFRFCWKDGRTMDGEGIDADQALSKLGYDECGDLSDLISIKELTEYRFYWKDRAAQSVFEENETLALKTFKINSLTDANSIGLKNYIALQPGDTISVCKECGEEFVLTHEERYRFKSLTFSLPKRCKVCRNKRRDAARITDLTGYAGKHIERTKQTRYGDKSYMDEKIKFIGYNRDGNLICESEHSYPNNSRMFILNKYEWNDGYWRIAKPKGLTHIEMRKSPNKLILSGYPAIDKYDMILDFDEESYSKIYDGIAVMDVYKCDNQQGEMHIRYYHRDLISYGYYAYNEKARPSGGESLWSSNPEAVFDVSGMKLMPVILKKYSNAYAIILNVA